MKTWKETAIEKWSLTWHYLFFRRPAAVITKNPTNFISLLNLLLIMSFFFKLLFTPTFSKNSYLTFIFATRLNNSDGLSQSDQMRSKDCLGQLGFILLTSTWRCEWLIHPLLHLAASGKRGGKQKTSPFCVITGKVHVVWEVCPQKWLTQCPKSSVPRQTSNCKFQLNFAIDIFFYVIDPLNKPKETVKKSNPFFQFMLGRYIYVKDNRHLRWQTLQKNLYIHIIYFCSLLQLNNFLFLW